MADQPDIAVLLDALGRDDERAAALEQLWPLVYDDLHRRAVRAMARERANHTLQPTALVHEAYLRLARGLPSEWEGRAHFLRIAARVMRQVLVDHARKRDALRRGGDRAQITFDEPRIGADPSDIELIDLHLAIDKLEQLDPRTAKVAEMRLFAGATVPEVAEALGLSPRTVDNEWATARMWLLRALRPERS